MRAATPLIALLGTTLLACGSSSPTPTGSSRTATTAMTKAEYVSRVDDLCVRGNAAADADNEAFESIVQPATKAAYREGADYMEEALKRSREVTADIEAIPAPRGDTAAVGAYLGAVRDGETVARLIVDALRDADVVRVANLTEELDRIRARRRGAAEAYGFHECGTG